MTLLLIAVFSASLLGSAHCAGMCGPLLPFYAAGAPVEKRWLGHLTYSLGRLVSYATLGALAGAAGSAVNMAGEAAGIIRVSAIAAGVLMILWGLGVLFARFGLRFLPANPLGKSTGAAFRRLFQNLQNKPPLWRAGMLGLASTLLPCGWLYAFAITAAGTGSPWQGALVMLL
ncbi:MAG: sulfite exporter TauE/SafE family protein, partial [Candidatus Cloacimonetes bacterium]|nr:sulfite exporter TauE/SafE family protein [Candidatus Cloacimonadota bacterium]